MNSTMRAEARTKRAEDVAALLTKPKADRITALRAELEEENEEIARLQAILISTDASEAEKEAALLTRYEAEARASSLALRLAHFEARG